MKSFKHIKGISMVSLIITILIIVILAAVMIPSGIDKINIAKITSFNENILTIKQEASSYFMRNLKYPIRLDANGNPIVYSILSNPALMAEAAKKDDQNDIFYILDLEKMGINNKDIGVGKSIDDFYIIAKSSANVYYAKGIKIGNATYYTKQNKGDSVVAVLPTSVPTPSFTPTPTSTLTPTSTPTLTPTSTLTPTITPTPTPIIPYDSPKIPSGFIHVGTEAWDNGFTIQDSSGNQFVWVPAMAPQLQANGTLDGTNFNSKFGRRRFQSETFNPSNYNETIDSTLQNIITSINRYGGFYIAKYEMSMEPGGKAQSKCDVTPWFNIDWTTSKAKAESMDTDWGWDINSVESYLCYGSQWDTALQWIIDSGAKSQNDVITDSTNWGNYDNVTFTYREIFLKEATNPEIINTGVSTIPANRHMVKGIYDLAGNLGEWTMESYNNVVHVLRGGFWDHYGYISPSARRFTSYDAGVGFRATLYVH